MTILESTKISTESLAGFLGMNVGTLHSWRNSNGLMAHLPGGHGRTIYFSLSDCLRVYVAQQLIRNRAPAGASASFANGCDALGAFLSGRPLVVTFRDGAPVLAEPDLAQDQCILVPLEAFGRELADWLAHHAAARFNPETREHGGSGAHRAFLAELEARIAEARR